jgi:hypothetical protein
MEFYFLNADGKVVCYTPSQSEIFTQSKGRKDVTTMTAEFWDNVGRIGGVIDNGMQSDVVIQPTNDNLQTIGVRYVVSRGVNTYVGFGSSNEYSTTKSVSNFNDKYGNPKTSVSGSAVHALEMAVKRAKNKAIAAALGLPHGEVHSDKIISIDLIAQGISIDSPDKITISRGSAPTKSYSSNKSYNNKPSGNNDTPSWGSSSTKSSGTFASKNGVAPIRNNGNESNSPQTTKTVSKPASAAPTSNNAASGSGNDDPADFVLTFGKHNGRTLRDLLYNKSDKGYISWLAKGEKDTPAKRAAIAMLEKYGELFNDSATSTNNVADTIDYRAQLQMEWKKRGYDDTNDDGRAKIKESIGWALKIDGNFKWEDITQEQAHSILNQIDVVFPDANQPAQKIQHGKEIRCAGVKEDGTPCNELLQPPVVEFCKNNAELFQNNYYCFAHQNSFFATSNDGEIM